MTRPLLAPWCALLLLTAACLDSPQGDSTTSGGSSTTGTTGGSATSEGTSTTGSSGSSDGSSSSDGTTGGDDPSLPDALPFDLDRPPDGDPPSPEEIAAFTTKLTGFWRDVDYFRWASWHSHGLHPSFDASMPDYKLWWQDTQAVKAGDVVTFVHTGPADNIMIRTPKVLKAAAMGYLATGDPVMGQLASDYAKGTVALFQGLVYGEEDPPVESITARAIFTHNHGYSIDGRSVAVDYEPVKVLDFDWNGHTVPNPDNPYFGDIWVRNMRSKDDVPHMFRLVPVLMRVARDAPDADVADAANAALASMQAFAEDIVDHDYQIRTKEAGNIFTPEEDLAVFSTFECTAKLSAALIGKRDPSGNSCVGGVDPAVEAVAISINYFNGAILHYFHLAAVVNALATRHDEIAETLLTGVIDRADWLMYDEALRTANAEWDPDLASFLVSAASSGLPLTGNEARLVQAQYSASVDHYAAWPLWDLWDGSVADGIHPDKPSRSDEQTPFIRAEEMTFIVQYCASPWKNPNTVELIDCAVVLDPSRWGE